MQTDVANAAGQKRDWVVSAEHFRLRSMFHFGTKSWQTVDCCSIDRYEGNSFARNGDLKLTAVDMAAARLSGAPDHGLPERRSCPVDSGAQ